MTRTARDTTVNRALADGATGYDAITHDIRVVLSNMHHLVSCLREPQALDALEHAFQQQVDAHEAACAALRQRMQRASEVEADARLKLQSLLHVAADG